MYLWCKATFSVIPVPVDTVEYGEEWFLFKKCCLSKVLLVSQTQDACAHAGRHEERHACTKILSRCHSLHSGSLRSADRACSSRARGAPQCGAHHRLLQSRAAQTARVPPSVTAAQPPPRAAGTAARGILPRPLALPLAHPRHCPCSPSPFLSLAHPRRRRARWSFSVPSPCQNSGKHRGGGAADDCTHGEADGRHPCSRYVHGESVGKDAAAADGTYWRLRLLP